MLLRGDELRQYNKNKSKYKGKEKKTKEKYYRLEGINTKQTISCWARVAS